ncbi:MAG: hypothetical protein WCP65_05575 [Bacteroidota bacterium]
MHDIEPYPNWRHIYTAEEDKLSPFYGREYSEFEFTQTVYNYYIHPQWDDFGSKTLYLKIIYVDYELNFAVIELIGEWNDAIENDIMELKREVIDRLYAVDIYKFILITENVLNFHSGDKDYYEEWYEEVNDKNGWIVSVNMPKATQYDFKNRKLDRMIDLIELPQWRAYKPYHLFKKIEEDRLGGVKMLE